jgi:FkbM family methyltransferase
MRRSFLEYLILILDNFSQKKNFEFLKVIYGSKLETVFDIGCHKGETIDLLKKNFQIKKIFAFDINTGIIEKLKKKDYLNVSFMNYGVSNVSDKKEFNFSEFSPINSLKNTNKFSGYSKFKELVIKILNHPSGSYDSKKSIIDLITLDDFCEKKKIKSIDLVKIDIEGSELNALKGFKKNISNVKFFIIEHHYDNSLKKDYKFSDLNKILIKNNFKLVHKNKLLYRKVFDYVYANKAFIEY